MSEMMEERVIVDGKFIKLAVGYDDRGLVFALRDKDGKPLDDFIFCNGDEKGFIANLVDIANDDDEEAVVNFLLTSFPDSFTPIRNVGKEAIEYLKGVIPSECINVVGNTVLLYEDAIITDKGVHRNV